MSQELHYTSVPRGLKPGSRGFCTVGMTPHMPGPLVDRLEALSGYQPVFPPHDPSAALNPIVFSHLRLTVSGKAVSVLSRIGPAGLDYSGRPNKYAHHVVLEGAERPEAGPAWLLSQAGFMQGAWEGEPQEIPAGRTPPQGERQPGMARAWQALTGDGGWAGVLAESLLADPRRTVILVFRPGMDLLPLFVEALAFLPASRRWDVDFSTYFSQLPQGVTCAWRGVLEASDDAKNALRLPGALVLDLCHALGRAEGGVLVHLARTGERIIQETVSTPIPLESNRHIPQIPHETTAPAANPPSRPRTLAPHSTGASYELVPELARLVSGEGSASPSEASDQNLRFRRRPPVFVSALIVAFTIIGLLAGLILGIGSVRNLVMNSELSREIAENRMKVAEEKKTKDTTTVDSELKLEIAGPKTGRNVTAKTGSSGKDPNPSPIAAIEPKKEGSEILKSENRSAMKNPPVSETSEMVENPLFLSLDEPVSTLKQRNDQSTLHLNDQNFRLARMELLGLDQSLSCETKSDPLRMVVSLVPDPSLNVPGRTAKTLARFEVSSGKTIQFTWDRDQSPGNGQESDRRRLRDCVLKLVPTEGEPRYCILRSQPVDPHNPKEFSARLNVKHTASFTYNIYKWDYNESFKDTSRPTRISHCKISGRNGQDGVSLDRKDGASWAAYFRGEMLLSVKLDKSEILIDLHDGKPSKLPERVQAIRADIIRTEWKLAEYNKGRDGLNNHRNTNDGSAESIRDATKHINDLRSDQEKLEHIHRLYNSVVTSKIIYEVAGLKFVIARVEGPAHFNF